jgi:Zn finger protein HypA/HybF involved in hydrogenase expression
MDELPVSVECLACGAVSKIDNFEFTCSACGGIELKTISGDELLIDSMEGE